MCNLQRKLVWLLLFWRLRGPRHCIWRRSWRWSVSQSYFSDSLMKAFSSKQGNTWRTSAGASLICSLGILGPVSLQQRILLPWGIRTFADMWCFHLSLEGGVSLVTHNRIWTAACWGMGSWTEEMLEFCHIEREISSSMKEGMLGDGQVPVKHWSFNRPLPRSGSMLLTFWDAHRNGRKKPHLRQCLWHQSGHGFLQKKQLVSSSIYSLLTLEEWVREKRKFTDKELSLIPGFRILDSFRMQRHTFSIGVPQSGHALHKNYSLNTLLLKK